jgi:hypothetical protein
MQRAPAGVRYEWNEERRLTIPTAPVNAGHVPAIRSSKSEQILRRVTGGPRDRTLLVGREETALRPDIAFMRELLREYESQHEPYQTTETVGVRQSPRDETEVHIFEMYWADLSRLGSGLLRILGATYQLVQHVSQIGRKTVDIAAAVARAREKMHWGPHDPGPDAGPYAPWAAYAWCHSWAIRAFTVLVPVAALVMLAFLPLFIPAAIGDPYKLHVGIAIAAMLFVVGGGIAIYLAPPDRKAASIFVGYMIVVVVGALVLNNNPPADPARLGTILLTTSISLLSFGGLILVFREYNKTRSGALVFGVVALLAILARTLQSGGGLVGSLDIADADRVRDLALIGFEWAYALVMVTWLLLWITVLITLGVRFYLWWKTTGTARRRATRAVWTARATLGSSVFSFMLAALVLYRSVVYLASKTRGSFDLFPRPLASGQLPIIHAPGIVPAGFSCVNEPGVACAERFFVALNAQAATSGLIIAVLGLTIVFVLISWFIALIAFTSVKKPDPATWNGRRLGLWMTNGFWWLRIAGTALAISVLVAVLVGSLCNLFPDFQSWVAHHSGSWLAAKMTEQWTQSAIDTVTFAVLASAATAGAARLRLETLAKRARPAVGVVLDVDNYLRETPQESTPRARIAERFVSLLRHVREQHFDRVVIVSHSQGTVITTDLLRFLNHGVPKASPDHDLVSDLQCRLVTMGSPLRQLYGANFPHLYGWVNATDPTPEEDEERKKNPLRTVELPTISSRCPDPNELRVECWVNLYTSGDYVGRNLWCDDVWNGVWDRRSVDQAIVGDRRRERCLGAGTHTHYWESEDVAEELDQLIATPSAMSQAALAHRMGGGEKPESVPGSNPRRGN